ncbi:hypothetical protein DPV78_006294 [Talaromyces pinophilus]|nr:hypothetical protein DPV78_006294 [Talaromyces pinophilus]
MENRFKIASRIPELSIKFVGLMKDIQVLFPAFRLEETSAFTYMNSVRLIHFYLMDPTKIEKQSLVGIALLEEKIIPFMKSLKKTVQELTDIITSQPKLGRLIYDYGWEMAAKTDLDLLRLHREINSATIELETQATQLILSTGKNKYHEMDNLTSFT